MYEIYADAICIYSDSSPDNRLSAQEPKLSLSAGSAGSLSVTLSKNNAGYDIAQRLTTTMTVKRDDDVIWVGRILSENVDFWDSRELYCEGALAFLNDTIPMIANPTLASVLAAHNSKVAPNRRITLGIVEVSGSSTDEADGSTSLEIINSKLVGAFGGVLRMRYPNGIPTLDWLLNYPAVTGNEQELEFGSNLLDFTRSWDMSDYATYCYVRGAEIEQEGESDVPTEYYNSGWIALSGNPSPASLYGRIEKYQDYSDLESNAECIAAARTYLATQQFSEMTLDVTALDLHILNPQIKSFDLLERVHTTSWAHGLDSVFAVTDIDIPLDAPENTSYTFGFVNVEYVRRVNTLTKKNQQTNEELNNRIDEEHEFTESELSSVRDYADDIGDSLSSDIQQARDDINATMSSLTEGYVFIDTNGTTTQGIYITDSPIHSVSDITSSMHVWKWSATGLGYSDDGGTTWKVAMTHDGKINADMIVTGLLLAQYIKLYGDMIVYDGNTNVIGGRIGYGTGQRGSDPTKGVHMYVDQSEIIATNSGVRLTYGGYNVYISGDGLHVGVPGGLGCDLYVNGDIHFTGTLYQD